MYRTFPGWIGAIFIRRVEDVEPMNETEKNKPERFEKAFKDVPADVWTVFEDPKVLVEKVQQLGSVRV
jgi:phosphatidate phosphatase APP1